MIAKKIALASTLLSRMALMVGGVFVGAWGRGWAVIRGQCGLPWSHRTPTLIGGGVALAAVLLLLAQPVYALAFPWLPQPGRGQPTSGLGASSRLQEVAPPAAVQQLRRALDEHIPRLELVSPASGSVLPAGPWTLRMKLEDWPLVDAGPLGLGPHLVVQLDEEEPLRLTSLEATMPPLSPGSHRLTVFAARPWGEAVKSPGAYRQIPLHRAAANPLTLPLDGTPQLIPVSPMGGRNQEPILLDWLLIDAPLQNFHSEEAGWRLRVTVNNDSFLVDRQSPLWLKGWKPGANAVLLELVDPRGEPLNPPFNSVVTEVTLGSMPDQAPWQRNALPAETRAILLGDQPYEAEDLSGEPTGAPQAPATKDPLEAPLPERVVENENSPDLEDQPSALTEPSDPMPMPMPPLEPDDLIDAGDDVTDASVPEPLAPLREGAGFEDPDRDSEEVDRDSDEEGRELGNSNPGDPAFGDPEPFLGPETDEIAADAIRATGSPAGPRQGWNS